MALPGNFKLSGRSQKIVGFLSEAFSESEKTSEAASF
jgi:hypothetical protein